ncbi:MAG TPA: trehalose-6-phosphate synthase [Patescibacteria group bacterium]|nr:trehalose-6-phosphate synthase [Patescibacteria group bacterium]
MTYTDLQQFLLNQGYKLIIVADGQTRAHEFVDGEMVLKTPAGGVSVVFDTLARAGNATYIARGRSNADRRAMNGKKVVDIVSPQGNYRLKRLFFSERDTENYYFGFANQTLWPLSHASFEQPAFNSSWYEGYKKVNKAFAQAIMEEVDPKAKTLVWINDYQLSLVPTFLPKLPNMIVSFFWHIPWPTWEIFRILPQKKDILWSLLSCDYLAFHRRYQVENFLNTVDRELEARIERETSTVYFDSSNLVVDSLAMGIDTDVVRGVVNSSENESYFAQALRNVFQLEENSEKPVEKKKDPFAQIFERYQVILGIDRLDYTKGLLHRLQALDLFFTMHPRFLGKVVYIGIMSPSREQIPSYKMLRRKIENLAKKINQKYTINGWRPLRLIYQNYTREDVINLYKRASVCLVTPLDDGMNLVSKEFVIAASAAEKPGVLVLSQFAGSATDLHDSLLVNPYDTEEVVQAIYQGLTMSEKEKKERNGQMVNQLEEHNIYEWCQTFIKNALSASRRNRSTNNK